MKKRIALCMILALALTGCSNTKIPTNENATVSEKKEVSTVKETDIDETQVVIDAINDELTGYISDMSNYKNVNAYKDASVITIKLTTKDYIWDSVNDSASTANTYKDEFKDIYGVALEAAKQTGIENIQEIDILVEEPDGSCVATGDGTVNSVKYLFE